jgi:hypothetical protein
MNDPLRRLKQLPWLPLFLVALLTLFWASVLEWLLALGANQISLVRDALLLLFAPPLNLLMLIAIAIGLGALAVLFLEIMYPQLMITTGTLWALILCVFGVAFIRGLLPSPLALLAPSYSMLIGILLGVFLKGKPYWRY